MNCHAANIGKWLVGNREWSMVNTSTLLKNKYITKQQEWLIVMNQTDQETLRGQA
jgi:hypothetical protein